MTKRKSPAFSFYPDSFLSAVSRWTFEQRGVYITLLGDQWVNGRFSKEQARVICAGADPSVVDFVLREKFEEVETGRFANFRLEEERVKQEKNSKTNSTNGKKGGRPKRGDKPKINPTETERLSETKAEKKPSDSDSDSVTLNNKEGDDFIPPTVEEVQGYIEHYHQVNPNWPRDTSIDAQGIVDHYDGQGWVKGNGIPIRDWEAVVRSWGSKAPPKQPRGKPVGQSAGQSTMQNLMEIANEG